MFKHYFGEGTFILIHSVTHELEQSCCRRTPSLRRPNGPLTRSSALTCYVLPVACVSVCFTQAARVHLNTLQADEPLVITVLLRVLCANDMIFAHANSGHRRLRRFKHLISYEYVHGPAAVHTISLRRNCLVRVVIFEFRHPPHGTRSSVIWALDARGLTCGNICGNEAKEWMKAVRRRYMRYRVRAALSPIVAAGVGREVCTRRLTTATVCSSKALLGATAARRLPSLPAQ